MQCNDNHINSPLRKIQIDVDKIKPLMTEYVTREFYDKMEQHDPGTVYIITDESPVRVYQGDVLIPLSNSYKPKYFMTITDDGEYAVYEALWQEDGSAYLYEIERYDDPQKALNSIKNYQSFGPKDSLYNMIYITLMEYISKENGLNETIIHIMAQMGYRDDIRLQNIIDAYTSFGGKMIDRDVPLLFANWIKAKRDPATLTKLYADIYEVFLLYDFFKGKTYKSKDLEEPVQRIVACMGLV